MPRLILYMSSYNFPEDRTGMHVSGCGVQDDDGAHRELNYKST